MEASKKKVPKGKGKARSKVNAKEFLRQAAERLERINNFQKKMDNQVRISKEIMAIDFSI